jgi:hypothetical protein
VEVYKDVISKSGAIFFTACLSSVLRLSISALFIFVLALLMALFSLSRKGILTIGIKIPLRPPSYWIVINIVLNSTKDLKAVFLSVNST